MLLGEDSDDALDDLRGGIEIWGGVVDGREVGLGERQHEAVEVGNRLEGLGELVAQEVPVCLAEEVELAVGVQQFGRRLEEFWPDGDFAVPVVDGLSGAVGEREDFAEAGAVGEDAFAVEGGGDGGEVLVEDEAVHAAQEGVAFGADLEAVASPAGEFGDEAAHIIHIQRGRMHDGPGDFRLGHGDSFRSR